MHVVTVAWDQLINIHYAFLNSVKCKILEIPLKNWKFLQINNNIRYLLAALNSPPAYKIERMKTKLTEMHTWSPFISRCLLLVSVILQISNLETILYSGHFSWYTLYTC